MYQLGWFSTGRDEAARDLLKVVQEAIDKGEIKAEIAFVFSNREPGEDKESDLFFQLVKSYQIPLVCFSSAKFKPEWREKLRKEKKGNDPLREWRLEYDRQVMKRLEKYQPDLCVLSGYMLIVGEEMCQKYNMINLHPAAPGGPAGTWQEVIWKLIEGGAQETGVMMHLVTPELDKGPPVTYCKFSIRGEPFDECWKEVEEYSCVDELKKKEGEENKLFKLIRQYGVRRELPLIVATIKAFAEGKVRIEKGKVLTASGEEVKGYCLTEEIDRILREE